MKNCCYNSIIGSSVGSFHNNAISNKSSNTRTVNVTPPPAGFSLTTPVIKNPLLQIPNNPYIGPATNPVVNPLFTIPQTGPSFNITTTTPGTQPTSPVPQQSFSPSSGGSGGGGGGGGTYDDPGDIVVDVNALYDSGDDDSDMMSGEQSAVSPSDMVGVVLSALQPVTLYKIPSLKGDVMGTIVSGGYVGKVQSYSQDSAGNIWWQVTTNVDNPDSTDPNDNSFVMHSPNAFDNDSIAEQVTSSGNPVTDIQSGVNARSKQAVTQLNKMNTDQSDSLIPGWVLPVAIGILGIGLFNAMNK